MSEYLNKNEIISLQVILKPLSRLPLDGSSLITSSNIELYKPAPGTYDSVKEYFSELMFDVGPIIGISFSITAKAIFFTKIFKVKFKKNFKGSLYCIQNDGSETNQLPLTKIPEIIADKIDSVIFPEPIDFGPVDY